MQFLHLLGHARLDRHLRVPHRCRYDASLGERSERHRTDARQSGNRHRAALRVVDPRVHGTVHKHFDGLEIHRLRGTSPEHALPRCADHARVALSLHASRLRRDRTPHRGSTPCAVRLLPNRHRQVAVSVIDRHAVIVQRRMRELRNRLQMAEAATIVRELPCETAQVRGVRGRHYRGSLHIHHR